MMKDLVRRPSSRLIAYTLTFGVLGVGVPRSEAAESRFRLNASHEGAPARVQAKADAIDMTANVFIEFQAEPAMLSYAKARDAALALVSDGAGLSKEVGVGAGRAQANRVRTEQNVALPRIEATGARVLFQTHRAVNGIAVRVDKRQLAALRSLPGVKRVHVMVPQTPGNSTSVPFLGIPASVWDSATGAGVTGAGVKIGIIDTGIDYQHANFGGTGLLADYQANDRTSIAEGGAAAFPTAKVVGGWDFAGDAYTASNAPVPDPDPMDCNGHGTHVAGTAAGLGVNSDGTTFAGPYDGTATIESLAPLRIGPGTAPGAELYALRVFGCKGSTNLTAEAIDWAMDPNGDDDFSDHLDVINMSLGSSFGSLFDESVEASNNAAAAGVIVVASAGNSGDVYFITGAPGGASGALSVAASTDALPTVGTSLPGGNAALGAASASFGQQVGLAHVPDPDTNPSTLVDVVLANDGTGVSASDGCCGSSSPWVCGAPNTWTNAAAVAGKVVIVDRGTCEFAVKAYNAQINGAIGVVIANNQGGTIVSSMGNSAAAPAVNSLITVPSLMVSQNDGTTLKTNIAGLQADMFVSASGGNTLASFSSRGPRRGWGLKPDVAAPGSNITSSQTGVVCTSDATGAECAAPFNASGFSPNSQALTISGTSMASPHVAGMMATLKQLHPTWSPRELRALLISTSTGDLFTSGYSKGLKYAPGRVGGGETTMPGAASSDVIIGDGPDYVGLSWERDTESFGTEIAKPYGSGRNITVQNKGTGTHSYNVSYVPAVDNPGIAVSFPNGTSITLGPKKKLNLKVQVTSSGPSSVVKKHDPTVTTVQTSTFFANVDREWQGEESGYVVLTPTSGDDPILRLPFHMAPRPTSALLAKKFATPLTITGTDFFNTNSELQYFGGEAPIGTFFEWQGDSPNEDQGTGDPTFERTLDAADLRQIGVASHHSGAGGTGRLFFGVSTWGNWSTPNEVEFTVFLDGDGDGQPDVRLFNGNSQRSLTTTFGSTAWTDSLMTHACSMAGSCLLWEDYLNSIKSRGASTQLFNSNVMVLGAFIEDLTDLTGIDFDQRFHYWVQAESREGGFDLAGPFTYDPQAPGLSFDTLGVQALGASPWEPLENGTTLDPSFDAANFVANDSLGLLALYHHNAGPTKTSPGNRSEALPLGNWVTIGDASIAEGNIGQPTLNFTVSLHAPATSVVSVKLATADDTALAGSDYVAKTAILNFAAGQTTKPFSVKIKGDIRGCLTGDENMNETFFVNVLSATGAAIDDGQAVGTILGEEAGCP